ncbi:MAG TPA: hypothetical protein VGX37_14050 [Allosphingosinicella sp.]|nr:hypothetical protein [Allosphingosinicella sp.]
MFYLGAGLFCLFAAAFAAPRMGWAAAAVALAATGYAFFVYRWWVPPAAAAIAAAGAYLCEQPLRRRQRLLPFIATVGAVLAAFAVFGPRDGLF